MDTVLIFGLAVLLVVFIYIITPNTYSPLPPYRFTDRLNRNNMHTALMVNAALNIKTKNMDSPKGEKLCNCGPETYLHGKTGTTECGPGNTKRMLLTAVSAVRDDNGHWYIIPKELHDEFRSLLEKSTDTRLKDDEMYDAQDKFISKFSQYMTGGDLNNVQLYAEIKPE